MKSLSQMTEEELKTLCKSLEERYCGNSTVTLKQVDFNNMWASIDRYAKENKRLQEQLEEANKALKDVCMHAETEQFECRCGWVEYCKDCNAHYSAKDYLKKWGVK